VFNEELDLAGAPRRLAAVSTLPEVRTFAV
jgi:hypothetical protein